MITDHGQKLLRSELKQLGILGLRGRIKVGVIGIHLVTLGAFLRISQTNEIAELNPPGPLTREGGEPGIWAWSQYPQEAPT